VVFHAFGVRRATDAVGPPRRDAAGMLVRPLLLAGLGAMVYGGLVERRLNRLGATDEELRTSYPGHDAIIDPYTSTTMATTIDAPPCAVWPWLVQMGCDRAGFYSYDRLDNGGVPSAERIHPEWQDLHEGGRVACTPSGRFWFDVERLVPERTLVLRGRYGGRRFATDSTWGFHLRPTDDGGTRLVVHGSGSGHPRSVVALVNHVFWAPAHWIMQLRQFAGLRRRAKAR
jgi:proline iminopeptidase